jgi:phosphatidylinositol alpha-mannosyltransferase
LSKNQQVIFNGNRVNVPLPASQKRINKVLEDENFDVLHVQVPYSPFMAQKVINATAEKTVIFGTFHILPNGILASWGSRALRLMYGRSIKKFNEIVSVSKPSAKFAKSAYGISSQVIPNAVDMNRFASVTRNVKKDDEQIVFLGRLVERKGCEQLIRAFSLLNNNRPKTKLIIAGKGPQKAKLEKLVKSLKLEQAVSFVGFIEEEDKPELLSSANIACFPSLGGESFGIVLIEAMAAGSKVVIAGNNPGYSSVLEDKPELLINPRDHKLFAKKLEEFLENDKFSSEIQEWQRQQVKRYDINVVGAEILNRYYGLIDKKTSKEHN